MKLIYLACPYTDKDEQTEVLRYITASVCAADRMKRGELIFSPITHSHPIKHYGRLEGTFEFWKDFCLATLSACQEVYVLTLPGWKESLGVQAEIKLAMTCKMPVSYLHPFTFDIIT